jgi:hypothetical protein
MALFVYDDARILLNQHDVSGDSNKFEMTPTGEIVDVSTFGSTWRKRIGGITGWTFGVDGFMNIGADTHIVDTLTTVTTHTIVLDGGTNFTADMVGQILTITGGVNAELGEHVITGFTNTGTITTATPVASGGNLASGSGYIRGIKRLDTLVNVDDTEVTVIPQGFTAGNEAFFGHVSHVEHVTGGAWGEPGPFALKGDGDGPFVQGILLEQTTKNTAVAGATSAAQAISTGVPAGYTLWAALHVLNCTGVTPTLDVKVQSTTAWQDRITFAQATTRSSQLLSDTVADTDTTFRTHVTTTAGVGDLDIKYVCVIGVEKN